MEPNLYLPPALPLLSDAALARLRREYEAAYLEVARAASQASEREQRQLREALSAVHAELRARGIEGEPWWVTRPGARPPRRLSTPPAPSLRSSAQEYGP